MKTSIMAFLLSFFVWPSYGQSMKNREEAALKSVTSSPKYPFKLSSDNIKALNERFAKQQKFLVEADFLREITRTTDTQKQHDSIEDLLLQRQGQATVLIQQVNSPSRKESFAAAYLLGELRFHESLPVLVRLIAKKNTSTISLNEGTPPTYGDYPIAEAIKMFGREAPPTLLEYLALGADNHLDAREVTIDTLIDIEGMKIARFIVNDREDQETDTIKKARLRSVEQEIMRRGNLK